MTEIEVFADVVCPFTHVGLRRLVERRAELGAVFAVRVRAWPLELVNRGPLDADAVAEKVAVLRATVAPDLFGGFDREAFPYTSLAALALVAAAYRRDAATGERASLLVRDALFERGIDISGAHALQRIAQQLGVHVPLDAEDDVLGDWREGRRRGVIGSPHFFVGGRDYFCPALRIDHVDGKLRIEPDQRAFDAFIEECVMAGP